MRGAAPILGLVVVGAASSGAGGFTNPLRGLPALKKTHYSWPLPFVSATALGGAQVDFARITHSFPLYLYSDCGTPTPPDDAIGQNRSEVFEAVAMCHAAGSNATLALNWSPWYSCFEAPHGEETVMGDPRVTGAAEASYLAEWKQRLSLYRTWLAEANAFHGAAIEVGAVLLDSERFWFNCSEQRPWGRPGHPDGPYGPPRPACGSNTTFNEEWFDAITRKHDLTTALARSVFPGVAIQNYGRGSVHIEPTGPPFISPHFTLHEAGSLPYSAILYSVFEPWQTRVDYNATAHFASAQGIGAVTPWIGLGSGYRRNFTETVYVHEYDYDRQLSWGLGYEIDNSVSNLGADWSVAKDVVLFPSPFECQVGRTTVARRQCQR